MYKSHLGMRVVKENSATASWSAVETVSVTAKTKGNVNKINK